MGLWLFHGILIDIIKKRRGQKLYSEDSWIFMEKILMSASHFTSYILHFCWGRLFLGEIYEKGGSSDTISGLSGYLYSLIIVLFFADHHCNKNSDFIRSND